MGFGSAPAFVVVCRSGMGWVGALHSPLSFIPRTYEKCACAYVCHYSFCVYLFMCSLAYSIPSHEDVSGRQRAPTR